MDYYLSMESLAGVPADPTSKTFPILGGGFFSSTMTFSCMALVIQVLLPLWMKSRKSLDDVVRPIMVIWSGLLFGINGAGFMVTLVLTDMGRDTIKCAATSPGQNDFHLSVIRYSGYVYFLLKFLDFGRIVFAVLRRKRHQATVFAFLQCCLVIMLVQSGVYFSPDGIVLFIAIVDTVLGCFINSYYILAAAKYFNDVLYWKRRLVFFQMLGYLTLVFHSCYFLIQPSCQHHRLVLYVQGIYGGSCFLFSGLRFLSLLLKKTSFIRLPNSEKNRNNLKVH